MAPNHFTIVVILLLVSSMAQLPISTTAATNAAQIVQPSTPGIHITYWLVGDQVFNWNGTKTNPGPLLSASDGDTVSLLLESNESAFHNWFLDFNNNDIVDTNELTSQLFTCNTYCLNFTFTATLLQTIPHGGVFTYKCRYHPLTMFGSFKFFAGPVTSFTYAPGKPFAGNPVSFDASSSWPSTDASIMGYRWNFGDGNATTTTSPVVQHSYSNSGLFTVSLDITDTASQNGHTSQTLKVVNDYIVFIAPSNGAITQGQTSTATVSLTRAGSASDNVSLTSTILPVNPSIRISFNTSNGFPSYAALISIATSSTTSAGTYIITVMAVSDAGVAHNATFLLTVKQSGLETLNYIVWATIGSAALVTVLTILLLYRRKKTRRNRDGELAFHDQAFF